MIHKITILYLEHRSDIIGGGQLSLLLLLKNINKEKFNPILLCSKKGELSKEAKKYNIKTVFITMPGLKSFRIFKICQSLRKIINTIKEENINILHANSSRSMIYAALVRIVCHISIVWHVRITDKDRILDRILQAFATKIIAISKATERRFSWIKDQSKIAIIYNGLELKPYNNSYSLEKLRNEFSLNKEAIIIGTVAKLQPKKGMHIVIDSIPEVRKIFPNTVYFIVGDDADEKKIYLNKLKTMVQQLNEKENVCFTGFRGDIPRLMNLFHIFVLPSFSESFGRVILEAMAARKPVIASNVGGIPEVVDDGETGILVPPGDAEKIAEAIIYLLHNERIRTEMGSKGRKRVEELFTIEKNVEMTEQLYMDVVRRRQ